MWLREAGHALAISAAWGDDSLQQSDGVFIGTDDGGYRGGMEAGGGDVKAVQMIQSQWRARLRRGVEASARERSSHGLLMEAHQAVTSRSIAVQSVQTVVATHVMQAEASVQADAASNTHGRCNAAVQLQLDSSQIEPELTVFVDCSCIATAPTSSTRH